MRYEKNLDLSILTMLFEISKTIKRTIKIKSMVIKYAKSNEKGMLTKMLKASEEKVKRKVESFR